MLIHILFAPVICMGSIRKQLVAVLMMVNGYFGVAQETPTYTYSSKGPCEGLFFDPKTVINSRTPELGEVEFNMSFSGMPVKCMNHLNGRLQLKINEFRKQDYGRLQSILNNYCSHARGWIEKEPGTCQAGGPPPTCPADHWIQSPGNSAVQYDRETRKLRKERLDELEKLKVQLMGDVCRCWEAHITQTNAKPYVQGTTEYTSDRNEKRPTTTIAIPCLNGGCGTNYHCENGICVPDMLTDNQVDAIEFGAVLLTPLIERALKNYTVLSKMWRFYDKANNLYDKANNLYDIFDVQSTATDNDDYRSTIKGLENTSNDLQKLFDEQERFMSNRNMTTANQEERKRLIAEKKERLKINLDLLDEMTRKMEDKKKLGNCTCYNVMKQNNSLLRDHISTLTSKEVSYR